MSESNIKRMSLDDIRKMKSYTDWDRLRRETAAGIEPELDEEELGIEWDWDNARLVMPEPKRAVSLRLDADVLDFFKAQGKGYQTRMNAVLRAYMEAQKKA
ncbi:MAG: hypothetical protein GC186_00900 [Rhodobacteraceae bacterium]|nr:hypothetical protein [Paracoccaceae bacterium]